MFTFFTQRFYYWLLAIGYLLIISCENNIQTVNSIGTLDKGPVETGKNVEITYSDSAKIKIKLFAIQLDRYTGDRPYLELTKGVKIDFFDREMNLSSRLTAKYAIRYEMEKKMEAKNDVVVVNKKGEQLNTEHLTWDEEKHIIYSESFVRITTAKEIIFGDGLESNEDFSKYKIKNIKGTINIDENE